MAIFSSRRSEPVAVIFINFCISSAATALKTLQLAPLDMLCCGVQGAKALLQCANTSVVVRPGSAPRVAIITLVTPNYIDEYTGYSAAINAAYAQSFNHTFTASVGSPRINIGSQDKTQLVWRAGNVAAILDMLEDGIAEWVLWLDADAVLVDFGRKDSLASVIKKFASQKTSLLISRGELIGPGASTLFNSGFVLVRRNPWSIKFVGLWLSELLKGRENDQEVLERLYKANVNGAQSRIEMLPHGLFYSNIGDPIAGPPREQHAVHLAGLPAEVRRGVFGRFWRDLCAAAVVREDDTDLESTLPWAGELARSGIATNVLPESNTMRSAYLEEVGRYISLHTDMTEVVEGRVEACSKLLGVATQDLTRPCLETAERFAYGLRKYGRLEESYAWAQAALNGKDHELGAFDADTLSSKMTLAESAEALGRLEDAVVAARSSVAGQRVTYGERHRAKALAEAKLGSLLSTLGRLEEAEHASIGAWSVFTELLGPEHPSTLGSTSNLAALRIRQGKIAEAAWMYKAASSTAASSLGKGHITTLNLLQNAADAFLEIGQFNDAQHVARKLVTSSRKSAGKKHKTDARVAKALETLASTLHPVSNHAIDSVSPNFKITTNMVAEAELLLRDALNIYATNGEDATPETVSVLHKLAEMKQAQGRVQEAMQLFTQAFSGSEKISQPSSQDATRSSSRIALQAGIANNLGSLLRSVGGAARASEAEALLRVASSGFQATRGGKDISTWRATGNLADHLRGLGRLAEALPLSKEAVLGLRAIGSSARKDTLIGENNLALLMYAMGRNTEAESWYRSLVAGTEELHGLKSVEASQARGELAELLKRFGRISESEHAKTAVVGRRSSRHGDEL